MRLTHLKLAGFKSFVDATTIKIKGDRAGIVGPNGCGKSNVMESVKWVLGESSAKELRGNSMDAVIFNGSENRKPISRASVELIFDNSSATAAGEWAKYAEISVKRVIEREKGSTYYINNSAVRKKDVADLFLGTGLGGRAYAIIGQNTINRIVEAKPEELRVFLEEAAGISKYKERRRETELRLRDTRENLTRVEDILRELDKQIERLEGQAEVAARYQTLQEDLSSTNGQVLLLKKEQALSRWQSSQRQTENLVNELEAQVAQLRQHESAIETTRLTHIESTDAMNAAQAKYYEINAQVSALEGQIKNIQENTARMKMQLEQFTEQAQKHTSQKRDVEMSLDDALEAQIELEAAFEATGNQIAQAREMVEEKSLHYDTSLQAFQNSQKTLNEAEQSLRIEQNAVQYQQKSLSDTQRRTQDLKQQLATIVVPAEDSMVEFELAVETQEAKVLELEEQLQSGQQKEQDLNESIQAHRAQLQVTQKSLHTIEAEIASLTKLQQTIQAGSKGDLEQWLSKSQLSDKPRLWQKIKVAEGWETALEAALSGRLNALLDAEVQSERPPKSITLVEAGNASSTIPNAAPNSLLRYLEQVDNAVAPVLNDWLAGVLVADDAQAALQLRSQLSDGQMVVTKNGDLYTQHSVSYFGPQSQLHGVLERQADLEKRQNELPMTLVAAESAQTELHDLESKLSEWRNANQSVAQTIKQHNHQMQQDRLQLQKQQQLLDNALSKQTNLEDEIAIVLEKETELNSGLEAHQAKINDLEESVEALSSQKIDSEDTKNTAESARNDARSTLQRFQQNHQEQDFEIKLNNKTVAELKDKLAFLEEEHSHAQSRQTELHAALNQEDVATYTAQLEGLINQQQVEEDALAAAKNRYSDSEAQLQTIEKQRLETEQQLHPMRDKVEASRLAEQEKRLSFEQFERELHTEAESEEVLTQSLAVLNADRKDKPFTIKELESKQSKLARQIEALGAVNLAAIQELEAETTRRDLLLQQSEDLIEASETLENAIRKIDRETRGRLQETYDTANQHFSDLFTTLFNGGKARLELLGDEILDTGIQVFAQPPGKKNSTIHLLSGGEKALTAIALVFALFRLNPAPFCLMDEVDAPLDDSNTERFCNMVQKMSEKTQFLYVSHNKITMEMAQQLIGVTMQESGVSRIVDVDMEEAVKMAEA